MAEAPTEQDRSEPATPFKLDEARKKGMVPRSAELNAAAGIGAGLVCALAFAGWCTARLLGVERAILAGAGEWTFNPANVLDKLSNVAAAGLFVISPLLSIVVVVSLLTNFAQVGPVFSAAPLKPDFQRLNPAAGLQRLFSARSLFESFKVLLKLVLIIGAAYLVLRQALPQLLQLYARAPAAYPKVFINAGNHLVFALFGAAVVAAVADLAFTRWEFGRRMRMSRRELRDELKRREGDPQIRSKRRAILREMRRKSASVGRVRDADVLITNPQHYAVALKYRRGAAPAPEVIAKGAGFLAVRMRELAFKQGIPIFPSPRLARELFHGVRLGAPIAAEHYAMVAAILRWVYERRRRLEVRA